MTVDRLSKNKSELKFKILSCVNSVLFVREGPPPPPLTTRRDEVAVWM